MCIRDSRSSEILGNARAQAATIVANVKAEAQNVSLIIKNYPEITRQNYLDLRLMSVMEQAFEANQEQVYLLQAGGELRLLLGKDPVVDQIYRKQQRKLEEMQQRREQTEKDLEKMNEAN